jgi:predicted permease
MARAIAALVVIRENIEHASRGLRRSPGVSAAVVLTLALGIGVNATMFGVVDRLLLSPPPHVEDADQVRRLLVRGQLRSSGTISTQSYLSYADYSDWTEARTLASVATYATEELTLGRGAEARRVSATLATGSFFSLLGTRPELGRFFGEADDQPGAPGLVVLSHSFWQRMFGGTDAALGRTLDIGQGSYTVVGVAPPGFTGVDLQPVDVWLPMHALSIERGDDSWKYRRSWYWLQTIVRLEGGAALRTAEAEATLLHRNGRRERIESGRWDANATVVAAPIIQARGPEASEESLVARWLMGVSVIVLIIACANVANLLLARGLRGRKDVAIRLALGISRPRLVAQLLTESVLLAVLGAGVGLLLAGWGAEFVRSYWLPDIAWSESAAGPKVVVFAAVLSVVTGLAAGFVPALQASRPTVTEDLKTSAREGAVRRSRTRVALLVTQGALSVVLLVGAGLFVRSLQRVESIDLGVDAHTILLARLDLEPRERAEEEVSRIYERALERLRALPAVEHASASTGVPFWSGSIERLYVPGLDSIASPRPGPWIRCGDAAAFRYPWDHAPARSRLQGRR